MPKTLAKLTPKPFKKTLEWIYNKIKYFGFKYKCPVCKSTLRSFKEYHNQLNVRCPLCWSFARHRFAWLIITTKTNLFDGSPKKMLHFAPLKRFEKIFKNIPNLDYITTDLDRPDVMVKMDITDIPYSDNFFDIIYCSAVIEHILEDYKALCELRRTVKSSGWVLIYTSFKENQKTIEATPDMSPEDRVRLLGQADHVRLYGADFKDLLVKAGFKIQHFRWSDFVATEEADRYRIKGQHLFICTK